MVETLSSLHPVVVAAVISALVALATTLLATPLRLAVEKRLLRHKLETEYEYEQRKKLRELIGRYHGRVLEAAETLNHRFWNLYENEGKGWLDLGGKYDPKEIQGSYYFRTTIYRFLAMYSLARRFESESIYIDSRIADEKDLQFVKFLKALAWGATDVALFHGEQYDPFYPKDHFFRDHLRQMCDAFQAADNPITLEDFGRFLGKEPIMLYVAKFFDGLNSKENRFRWDRVVAIHLVLMGFINAFGYDMQRSRPDQLEYVASKIRNPLVLRNLYDWLAKLGLEKQRDAKQVREAIRKRLENVSKDEPLD